MRRLGTARTPRERLTRSEPFEVFTRPQRSRPARVAALALRLRAEAFVFAASLLVWVWLVHQMPAWVAAMVVGAVLMGLIAWPACRRYLVRRGFAVMTRHRLRAAFVERRVMNYSGNLPILLWSRPTAVGERVWVLLRAGIDANDIELALSYIAAACWAGDARVTPHRSSAALVVIDVIRRNPLAGPAVTSPLGAPPAGRRLRVVDTAALPVGGAHHA